MNTVRKFEHRFSHVLPSHLKDQDIRLSEDLLTWFIEAYTSEGDCVFDPFAGFGTTLLVAEQLGRQGYGVEQNPAWHQYAGSILKHPERLLLSDIRNTDLTDIPPFELCISSPIYMHRHESLDPLSGFTSAGSYADYIDALTRIYAQVASRMTDKGHLVVEASNLKSPEGITTFAWDLCDSLTNVLRFKGEVIANWDHYGYGYDHSYCLIFQAQ